ncbi:hypothetical protein [Deferrisoma camini]|uniref:hypothetical protein n=1 Tax=Deferrisoma camini TaxID=1035120 RepID=UPI00046D02F9|nr:hypothetical protein [Deferrisoma camini]
MMALTAAEANARIESWARHGLVLWNDLETKSTHASRVCPECLGGVRVVSLGYRCARGCGWEHLRSDSDSDHQDH